MKLSQLNIPWKIGFGDKVSIPFTLKWPLGLIKFKYTKKNIKTDGNRCFSRKCLHGVLDIYGLCSLTDQNEALY